MKIMYQKNKMKTTSCFVKHELTNHASFHGKNTVFLCHLLLQQHVNSISGDEALALGVDANAEW